MACYCFAHNQSFFKCLIYSDLSKKAKNIFNFYLDFNWEFEFDNEKILLITLMRYFDSTLMQQDS